MFNTRKRILVFNLLPIDNGPHVQQNDILFLCNVYQICGCGNAFVL